MDNIIKSEWKKLNESFEKLSEIKTNEFNWKKTRIIAGLSSLNLEVDELIKYIDKGESEEDKKDNIKINKIMSNIMPLMTYMWFENIE